MKHTKQKEVILGFNSFLTASVNLLKPVSAVRQVSQKYLIDITNSKLFWITTNTYKILMVLRTRQEKTYTGWKLESHLGQMGNWNMKTWWGLLLLFCCGTHNMVTFSYLLTTKLYFSSYLVPQNHSLLLPGVLQMLIFHTFEIVNFAEMYEIPYIPFELLMDSSCWCCVGEVQYSVHSISFIYIISLTNFHGNSLYT